MFVFSWCCGVCVCVCLYSDDSWMTIDDCICGPRENIIKRCDVFVHGSYTDVNLV